MGLFALKRVAGDDDSLPKHHISLVRHGGDRSVIANADLPFGIDDEVFGSSCRDLVYFMGENGNIVVCNIVTRNWIVFSLPSKLSDLPERYLVEMEACGIGYVPESGDYRLLRCITKHVRKEEHVGEVVAHRYHRSKVYIDLYSFNARLWKKIKTPGAAMLSSCAVCVGGSCYWTAIINPQSEEEDEDDSFCGRILAFDFATEIFTQLSFPHTSIADGEYAHSEVVDYRGLLGALIYDGPDEDDWNSSHVAY